MSRVLVTGAGGFIGSRLAGLLAGAGHEVTGPRRAQVDLLADPAAAVDAAAAPEVLVHLAWVTEHGAFWEAPENDAWVTASLALLRAFADAGGRRVVVAGTCAEYDWTTGAERLAEDAPIAPATAYGAAKARLHEAASALCAQAGVELAWGRIFFPYGPGEAPGRLVASVARALLAGEPARTTEGTQVRDLIHVDDVAGAFAALVDTPVGGAINVGAGVGVRIRDVVELVADAAGRPDLLRIGALPARPGDPAAVVADATRLTAEVGFRPVVGLAEGIAGAVESWRVP